MRLVAIAAISVNAMFSISAAIGLGIVLLYCVGCSGICSISAICDKCSGENSKIIIIKIWRSFFLVNSILVCLFASIKVLYY